MALRTVMRAGATTALAGLLVGCGSSTIRTTTSSPVAQGIPSAPSASTTAQSQPEELPIVHFTEIFKNPHAVWPFSARLSRITQNPNGFGGSPSAPPGDTYLMVQVDVTSQISGRSVPPPDLLAMIVCRGFHELPGDDSGTGYDQGDSAPDATGFNIAMGDGRPHPWDVAWLVPEGTLNSNVRCKFGRDPQEKEDVPVFMESTGPTRLN